MRNRQILRSGAPYPIPVPAPTSREQALPGREYRPCAGPRTGMQPAAGGCDALADLPQVENVYHSEAIIYS